jgi:UDP-glucose 4-epimerase
MVWKLRKYKKKQRRVKNMAILLPGGAGYIGSHTAIELLKEGKEIVIIDDFSNSNPQVLEAIKKITGKDFKFYEMDYRNKEKLEKVFEENNIEAVINFAGFKAVGESVEKPIEYYTNNISGALVLLDTMRKYNCKKFIFSSSATVYGEPERIPLTEDCKTGGTTNPYGTTKLFIEQILKDIYVSDNEWDICILRYFNPVGAHESGLIGEEPQGIPNNLMPYIVRVASGKLKELSVFGDDYDTPDGTGVRDYIHVVDLAIGHLKALNKIEKEGKGLYIYNLGTGTGYSVLDMVKAFEKTTGKKVAYKIAPRRAGDIATCYADPQKAKEELGWETTKTLEDMCRDSWNYIEKQSH